MRFNLSASKVALLALALLVTAGSLQAQRMAELVQDIYPGGGGSDPYYFTEWRGKIYFRANDNNHGYELWATDGTQNGTQMVRDIYNGGSSSSPSANTTDYIGWNQRFTYDDQYLYMRANDGNYSTEVWRTDGTNGGTLRISDCYSGGSSSSPHYLVAVQSGNNRRVYYRARSTWSSNYEPWYSEPNGNYNQVRDIYSSSNGSYPDYMVAQGSRVYFTAEHPSYSREVWYIDTSNNNCDLLRDIYSGGNNSDAYYLTPADDGQNGLFFRARNDSNNYELWFSDGTSNGTRMVKEIQPSTSDGSYPEYLAAVNGICYFSADDGSHGRELWRSDGTANGTYMVKDIVTGGGNSSPQYLTIVGDKVFFRCYHPSYGWELWISDGTEGGTRLCADIRVGPNDSSPEWMRASGGALYFNAYEDGSGRELYRCTQNGVVEFLSDIYPGTNSASPTNMEYLNGFVYFAADNGQNGQEMYRVAVPPSISETNPVANSVDAAPNTDISIDWDQDIDQNTVDTDSFVVRAGFSGVVAGMRTTNMDTTSFDPTANFRPGEVVEVSLTSDIANSAGLSPGKGRVFRFRVAAGTGPAEFDSALLASIGSIRQTTSTALADFNGDGAIDIALGVDGGQNVIFLNDTNGGFSNQSTALFGTGSDATSSIAAGDIDNDGDCDIIVGNAGEANVAYFNDGNGGFSTNPIAFSPGSDDTRGVALGDLNGDGFIDAVAVNASQQNLIHLNDGSGDFSLTVRAFGSGFDDSTAVAIGDVDADGSLDIAVANLFNPSIVYFNDGLADFTQSGLAVQIGSGAYYSTSIALGDLNGDGSLDAVLGNRLRKNLVLYSIGRNFPNEDIVFDLADDTDAALLADFDGDDALDIAFGNSGGQNIVYLNDGMGDFGGQMGVRENFGTGTDVTVALAAADLNADGDIDLVLGNRGEPFAISPNESATPTAPLITSTAPSNVTSGDTYSYRITATGVPVPMLSVQGHPNWLTLSGNTLSGTPSDADIGTTGVITVTASNGSGADAQEQFTITVDPRPEAPMITSSAVQVAAVGQSYSYQITTTGFPIPTLSVTGNPSWLTLVGNTLQGTPAAGDVGNAGPINIRADNGVGIAAAQSFTIVVSLEQAPAITSTAPTQAEVGDQYTYTVTTSGSPQPTITVTGLPAWLSFNAASGVISGIPATNDAGATGINTTGNITVNAVNGVGTPASQVFQITVLDTSRLIAPVIQSVPTPFVTVGQDYSYTLQIVGSPMPTTSVTGLPAWLSYDSAIGVISGMAMASDTGVTSTIRVEADNGVGQPAVQAFQIVVLPVVSSDSSSDSTCSLGSDHNSGAIFFLIALALIAAGMATRKRNA